MKKSPPGVGIALRKTWWGEAGEARGLGHRVGRREVLGAGAGGQQGLGCTKTALVLPIFIVVSRAMQCHSMICNF